MFAPRRYHPEIALFNGFELPTGRPAGASLAGPWCRKVLITPETEDGDMTQLRSDVFSRSLASGLAAAVLALAGASDAFARRGPVQALSFPEGHKAMIENAWPLPALALSNPSRSSSSSLSRPTNGVRPLSALTSNLVLMVLGAITR